MLTEQILKDSEEFKTWIDGRVSLIKNIYIYDENPTFIVISSDMGKFTITRFFEMGNKIQVSVDHSDISTDEVFELLLTRYSRKLN